MRRAGQTGFCIPHCSCFIAIHRAEIALTIDQRQAHRKILRHAYHRVVDGLVTVGVILAHNVTNNTRRLTVRLVVFVSIFFHGKQNSAMNRFQSIAHIGQCAAHNYAHCVIEIRRAHFVFDRYRCYVRIGGPRRGRFNVSCQKILPSNFKGLMIYVPIEYKSVMNTLNLAFFAPPYNYRTALIF